MLRVANILCMTCFSLFNSRTYLPEEFEDILTECESEEREMHSFFKARMEEAQRGLWEAQHQRMSALTSWGASAMHATRSAEVKPDNVKLLQWIQ